MKTMNASAAGELDNRSFYKLYSLFFFAVFTIIFSGYWSKGKSFVFCDAYGGGDGLVQHFNSFVYYGKYLRGIIRNFLREGSAIIPE